jgi:hypothetical protein
MPKPQGRKKRRNPSRDTLLRKAKDANTFSQLTYLLHLVTAINSNDKLQTSFQYHQGLGKARDKASSESQDVIPLDSIVAILVQEHEVVAACYTSDKVQAVMVAETDPNPSTDLDELATDSDESPAPGSQLIYPLRLAAVANPDYNSSNSGLNENPHNLHIETTGKNLWTRVRDSYKWHCAFM